MKTNLKYFRELKNLSQEKVAKYLGIPQTTYGTYEMGKYEADYSILLKLSKLYGATINQLLGETDENIILITRDELDALTKAKKIIETIEKNNPTKKQEIKIRDNHGKIEFK